MTNPTPEQLKLVAEYMGHNCMIVECGPIINVVGNRFDLYTPITNAEQSMELLKMLLKNNADFYFYDEQGIYDVVMEINKAYKSFENESLELAIFNAALAHITATQGEG